MNYRTNGGSTSTFVVDNKNQLTNAFGAVYGYDSNGNLTAGTNGHNAYVYDDENRLVQWFWYATDGGHLTDGALRTDFVYDGLGRLRERVEYSAIMVAPTNPPPDEESAMVVGVMEEQGSQEGWEWESATRYIYDGWRVIQERDTNNVPLVSYTRGNDLSESLEGAGGIGGLLARSQHSTTPALHSFYHADANGNITCLINTNQSVVARYRYDPFGNTISKTGTLADANVYRFSSKEIHVNSGMYCYGYRFYDPGLQRWVNRDPVEEEGGLNLYTYVRNNSINAIDPFGLIIYDEDGFPIGDRIGDSCRKYDRTKKPRCCPPGTVPLDKSKYKKRVHPHKPEFGAGPKDWVGISPDGGIWIGDENGKCTRVGEVSDYKDPKGTKPG